MFNIKNGQKIIVAAGSIRSGSTWLYNAIRLILLSDNKTVFGCWIDDITEREIGSHDFLVVKTHEPNDALQKEAWRIFTSHRDLRDVARSARDFLGICTQKDLISYLGAPVAHHDYWVNSADYDMKYEKMVTDAASVVQKIAEILSIKLGVDKIEEIVSEIAKLPEPSSTVSYDKSTLLHPRHRFSGAVGGWKGVLTDDQVSAIIEKFGWWMDKYGYSELKKVD